MAGVKCPRVQGRGSSFPSVLGLLMFTCLAGLLGFAKLLARQTASGRGGAARWLARAPAGSGFAPAAASAGAGADVDVDADAAVAAQPPCRGALSPPPLVVVYNRYPKSGSTTMRALIEGLGKVHGFAVADLKPVGAWMQEHALSPGVELKRRLPFLPPVMASPEEVIQRLLAHGAPAMVIGHFPYPANVTDARVAFINLVREPVEHCVSNYYYSIKLGRLNTTNSLEDCVAATGAAAVAAASPSLCTCSWFGSIPYLSGDAWLGTDDSWLGNKRFSLDRARRAELLARAKENVDERYAVVGILPEIAAFVARLEALLPQFFGGAGALMAEQKRMNARVSPPGPGGDAAARARARILEFRAADAEMYAHVKRRWEEQHAPCVGVPGWSLAYLLRFLGG